MHSSVRSMQFLQQLCNVIFHHIYLLFVDLVLNNSLNNFDISDICVISWNMLISLFADVHISNNVCFCQVPCILIFHKLSLDSFYSKVFC